MYIVDWWTGNLRFRAVSGALVLLGISAEVVAEDVQGMPPRAPLRPFKVLQQMVHHPLTDRASSRSVRTACGPRQRSRRSGSRGMLAGRRTAVAREASRPHDEPVRLRPLGVQPKRLRPSPRPRSPDSDVEAQARSSLRRRRAPGSTRPARRPGCALGRQPHRRGSVSRPGRSWRGRRAAVGPRAARARRGIVVETRASGSDRGRTRCGARRWARARVPRSRASG